MRSFFIISLVLFFAVARAEEMSGVPPWVVPLNKMEEELKTKIWPEYGPKERRKAEAEWKEYKSEFFRDIKFHGVLVDEKGDPVPNARVLFEVIDGSDDYSAEYLRKTNKKGEFKLEDVTGKSFTISMWHPEYYISWRQKFSFDSAGEKSEEPVKFFAKKRGFAEPLIHQEGCWQFKQDNSGILIDLISGEVRASDNVLEGVDLKISRIDRSKGSKNFLRIEVLGGFEGDGLVTNFDEFMFLAPETGYSRSIELGSEDLKKAGEEGKIFLYVRTRSGLFHARLRIVVTYIDQILFNYYLNPSRSRNLEFEPGNEIRVREVIGAKAKLSYPDKEEIEQWRKEKTWDRPDEVQDSRDFFY